MLVLPQNIVVIVNPLVMKIPAGSTKVKTTNARFYLARISPMSNLGRQADFSA